MSKGTATLSRKPGKITLQAVYAELVHLRERVEDLEDLRELNSAIARNKGKKLIPWATAKKELGWKIDERCDPVGVDGGYDCNSPCRPRAAGQRRGLDRRHEGEGRSHAGSLDLR